MSLGILGQKLGMTRIFNEAGQSVPGTVVAAGPCPVVDVRTPEKNGYSAVLLGFGERKPSKVTKPMKGTFERAGVTHGYSNSRTCEIGLTTHSGVPYASIVSLVNRAAAPIG